jgi:GxxExxY protein
MTKQEYKDIYDAVGAAMEVYNTLGRGMSELIYQEALAMEMSEREMTFEREKQLKLYYKGTLMEKTFYADFVYKDIIVELKSADSICSDHRAQLFNYMRITKKCRGILLNFGEKKLRAERYLYLPEDDNFILLTQDNYMQYITD